MFSNQIYFADNLSSLKKLPSESVDLIYIDPPFNTDKVQARTLLKTERSTDGGRTGFADSGDPFRLALELVSSLVLILYGAILTSQQLKTIRG